MGESPEIEAVAGFGVPRNGLNFGPFLLMPEWLLAIEPSNLLRFEGGIFEG